MINSHGRRIALTLTGGIDSTVLLYWVCENDGKPWFLSPTENGPDVRTKFYLVACNFGQANWHRTWELLLYHKAIVEKKYGDRFEFIAAEVKVPLPEWEKDNALFKTNVKAGKGDETIADYKDAGRTYEDVFIDGRNYILFSWLMSWCSKENITLLLTGHQYEVREFDQLDSWKMRTEDVSPMFIDRLNLMNECGYRFRTRIEAPFFNMRLTKYQIVKLGKDLGLDLGKDTFSCILEPACGECDNCIIRRKALAVLGVKEKQPYMENEKPVEELTEKTICDFIFGDLIIPPISDPQGKGWNQPSTEKIKIYDKTAVMCKETFDALNEYSTSIPTGVYPGKMWKVHLKNVKNNDKWFLRWFGESKDPKYCSNHCREIIIV